MKDRLLKEVLALNMVVDGHFYSDFSTNKAGNKLFPEANLEKVIAIFANNFVENLFFCGENLHFDLL